jgi:hypothetical protein
MLPPAAAAAAAAAAAHRHPLQLIVAFKPGVTQETKSKALGKVKADEKMLVTAGGAFGGNGGDVVLAKLTDNKLKRIGMKAAAADIKNGGCAVQVNSIWLWEHLDVSLIDCRVNSLIAL